MRFTRALKIFFSSVSRRHEALTVVRDALLQTIELEVIAEIVFTAIQQNLRIRKAIILLWEEERLEFVPVAMRGIRQFDITIPSGHPLVAVVRNAKGVLLQTKIQHDSSAPIGTSAGAATNAFAWLAISAVVPLFAHRELTGLLLLGDKEDGKTYRHSDVKFLNELGALTAVALENARLYKDALDFNNKLRQEVQEATRELEQVNIQLKNFDKAKSEFLSIASHQLYTPLTALRGYVSMIKDGDFGEIPEKQRPVLDILEKSATRLIDLIKNLLDVSRIESGKLELKLESIDLVELAKELVVDLMPNAMKKKIRLEFQQPATPVAHVIVDRERIRQVMVNFIDNAIKYTSLGRVSVSVYQRGGAVVFAVRDTGKGIRREEIAQLFNKFMRVGGSSRFNTEGTGLGLYVARQIIREHRGEVRVESMGEGQGSTFAMQLPAEGTLNSLKAGEYAAVVIKAHEAQPVDT